MQPSFCSRSQVLLAGVFAVLAAATVVAGCKTRPVNGPPVNVGRSDSGTDMRGGSGDDPTPGSDAGPQDANPNCPPREPGTGKSAGDACSCDNECSNGYCQEGFCCTGTSCGMRPPGAPCTAADQCETGFCADGVCCSQACTGGCVSCNQPERAGECVPVPVGAPDPHGVCRQDDAESCGQSGMCNGQGGCAKHASGTSCGLGLCEGGRSLTGASECDGDGVCVKGTPLDCAPFICEAGACKQSCTTDAHCIAPNVCRNGSCGPMGDGQTCTGNEQCASKNCVDGVCCNTACTGKCQFCASPGSRGKCTPVRSGARDPRGAAGVTDPAKVCLDQGPGSCGTDGTCDGSGGCGRYADGTVCKGARCDGAANAETAASTCAGGACKTPAARTCAPYKGCSGTRCLTQCGSDGQCAAGNVCTEGSCGARPVGALCGKNSDCAAPGICAQGRCCASACNGTCMACNVEGSLGTCTAVPTGGADPSGACRDDACNNGCNGMGGCRREAAGTSCKAPTCSGATRTTFACTAAGVCQMTAAACPAGQMCMGTVCAPPAKKGPGEACLAGAECASNSCVGGRCCATACAAACRVCNAATMFVCREQPNDTACGAGRTCQAGACVKKPTGAVCADGIECVSGSCVGGRCCATACAGPCRGCTAATMFTCAPVNEGGTCGTGQVCRNGECASACPVGQTMCGGACVDLRTNPAHCGACRASCGSGMCLAGTCTGVCPEGTTQCPPLKRCVNLNSNRNNCGGCNIRCPVLQVCRNGNCQARRPGDPEPVEP